MFFNGCKMLCDFGELRKGDHLNCIAINLGIMAWKEPGATGLDYDESAPLTITMFVKQE